MLNVSQDPQVNVAAMAATWLARPESGCMSRAIACPAFLRARVLLLVQPRFKMGDSVALLVAGTWEVNVTVNAEENFLRHL